MWYTWSWRRFSNIVAPYSVESVIDDPVYWKPIDPGYCILHMEWDHATTNWIRGMCGVTFLIWLNRMLGHIVIWGSIIRSEK